MTRIQSTAKAAETAFASGRMAALVWWLAPIALFLVSVGATHPLLKADTPVYCNDIERVLMHQAPLSILWESGHVLWRPLGYFLYPLFSLIPDSTAWTPLLKIWYGLTAINEVAALIATLLVFALCRRVAGNLIAVIPTALFVWGDAVLMYSRSGTSYIPGLTLLLAGLWWQLRAPDGRRTAIYGPAILFGLAGLTWLPYVIAIPAACSAGRFIRFPNQDKTRPRLSWTQVLSGCVTAGVVTVVGVATAAALAGVDSAPAAVAWLTAAGHGMHQNRQALRAVTGCSRLLLDLGWDGVYMKRFVFHDPYHPVSVASLFGYSLWKVAFLYLFGASVLWLAWRSPAGRRTLIPLALAVLPALFAAIVVFEPSSPERFLPVLPFLLLSAAAGLANPQAPRLAWIVVCLFTLLLPVMNYHGSVTMYSEWHRQVASQAGEFRANAGPGDTSVLVNMQEPLQQLEQHPFDPLNHTGTIDVFWAVDTMNAHAGLWPARVSRLVLDRWEQGKAAWVEKLALADAPADSLLWVEGDNPELHWRDVPAFFRGLDFDRDTGGADGFRRIAHSPRNEALFRSLTQ